MGVSERLGALFPSDSVSYHCRFEAGSGAYDFVLFGMMFYGPVNTIKVMSSRLVNLLTLFLGRLRPPESLSSTKCTYFRQYVTNALLESAVGREWP